MRKRTIEVVVVSDLYLGSEVCRAHELLTYLSSIKPKTLVLNGGLVAAAGSGLYQLPKIQLKVIKKIVAMASQGTAVYVLADEKDFYLKKLWGIDVGTIKIRKELVLDLDCKKTWFLHGQHFDLGQRSAVFLKPFGRYSYALLSRWNSLFAALSALLRSTKVDPSHPLINSNRLKQFRSYAISCAGNRGFETIACGYTGHADKHLKEGKYGDVLYLNSGNWLGEMTTLEYAFKRWKVYKYQADKCSAFYTDEDLKTLDLRDIKALADLPRKHKAAKDSKSFLHKRVS
ncbi:MAG: UDP-2,3-diacylglucosamine diphosphatase [Flavobacteriaceae bacterium]|nr:UDP-2,3-diacylglucosamine diphosphatase [Flavobacteriaceae bacterium]